MPKTLLAIKTFKKNDICSQILDSIREHPPGEDLEIVIADDNPGEALEVFSKYPEVAAYLTGNTHGIWANGNRLLKYFINNSDADNLLLLDNDIVFTRPGLLEEIETAAKECDFCENGTPHEHCGQEHITLFVIDAGGGDGLQATFPYQAISKSGKLKWHPGCHGIGLWFTRNLISKIGYMRRQKYFYGGEHSELSHRALRYQGYAPLSFPVLARSPKYISLNTNDYHKYDVDLKKVYAENTSQVDLWLQETYKGENLSLLVPPCDREITILREDIGQWDQKKIKQVLEAPRGKKKKKK